MAAGPGPLLTAGLAFILGAGTGADGVGQAANLVPTDPVRFRRLRDRRPVDRVRRVISFGVLGAVEGVRVRLVYGHRVRYSRHRRILGHRGGYRGCPRGFLAPGLSSAPGRRGETSDARSDRGYPIPGVTMLHARRWDWWRLPAWWCSCRWKPGHSLYVIAAGQPRFIVAGVVGLVFLGYYRARELYINLGIVLFCIIVFSRYFEFGFGLLDRSVIFIVAGSILIVGGFLVERGRRRVVDRMRGQEGNGGGEVSGGVSDDR